MADFCKISVKRLKPVWIRACIPCLGQTQLTRDYIPCLGQRGKKPYPFQRQDRAISRMGCIRVRPGRLCFQKIIWLQNQNITAEYQDCNWLAQVSVVQAS